MLGQGDLLYKDANSKLQRLQVPFLDNATLKRTLNEITTRSTAPPSNGPSREDLAFVASLLPEVQRIESKPAEWRGGAKGPDGTMQMPYPEYAPEVNQLVQAVYERKLILEGFDWAAWKEAEQFLDPARVRAASLEEIRQLLTLHVRMERFNDGHLAEMVTSGHVTAVLRRVAELAKA